MTRAGRPRPPAVLALLALLAAALFAAFAALGTWQVARRAWKLDLIARVEARVHAPPVPAPGPAAWPRVSAAADAYRHVRVRGEFLNADAARVQALSALGAGYWVLAPLRTREGWTVWVNRGFAPAERTGPAALPALAVAGPVSVTGLLRVTEPGGGFLRRNDPAGGRWYSRDVAALSARHGLRDAAPYFIDADERPNPGGWPVGGLTVVSFPNSHLAYAVTWYVLALMVLVGAGVVGREELRVRRGGAP